MAKNIHVVKITASSTTTAWAQAYHAGNLTAIVAVTPKGDEDPTSLHIVGKDLLNTFESEYFTLENKHLASIKQAVETTYQKSATTHNISFLVASVIQNTLYVVLAGNGSIFLIRQGKLGTLLNQDTEEPVILSSSGFLEHGDTVALATPAFLALIDKEKLFTALTENTITEAADILTPQIHAADKGNAAAIFIHYEDEKTPLPHELSLEELTKPRPQEETKEEVQEEPKETPKPEYHELPPQQLPQVTHEEEPIFSKPLVAEPLKTSRKGLSHRRKILLTVVIIILIVLGATIFFAIKKQQEAKNAALFNATFPQAQQKYQEAQGLVDLNPSVAKDDLTSAQNQLTPLNRQLIAGSSEQKQTQDLLSKIQSSLSTLSAANTVTATKVDTSTSALLAYAATHSDTSYFTDDTANIYTASNTGITQISKKSATSKTIIPDKSNWTNVGGFQTYLGNFYLLDTKAGILKFASGNYAKSNYFAIGVSPDLTEAVSIAIDGSIWVLGKDGSILKFTKGKQDSFTLSGLDTALSSPTRIVTSVDMDNIYILDNGNGRIVKADKTGKFIKSYATTLLKKATQMVVDEKAGKATFLLSGNLYQISL